MARTRLGTNVTAAVGAQHTTDNGIYASVVSHGSTAGTARPSGAALVVWIGSATPSNAATSDLWQDTTASPATLKRYNGSSFDTVGGSSSGVTSTGVVGPPTASAQTAGTVQVDTEGKVWVCQVAGTPGYWVPADAETFDPFAIAHLHRLIAKLRAGLEDVVIVQAGDSTGNDPTDWTYRWMQSLAALFPAYTVTSELFTDGTYVYGAPVTIQTGTGPRSLRFLNGSIGGMTTAYSVSHFAAQFVATPDLVIVNYGHNNTASTFTADYTTLTDLITSTYPLCGVVCSAQNPRTDTTANADAQYRKMTALRLLANRAGYGFVDVMQAFLNTASWQSALISGDGIHPNATGFVAWRDEWLRYLKQARRTFGQSPSPAEPFFGRSGDTLAAGQETMLLPHETNSTTQALGGATTSAGTIRATYFTASRSEALTQVKAITGATAAGATPTLCRMGFVSINAAGDWVPLAYCANDTTLFAAAGTEYTRALLSTANFVVGQRYAFVILVLSGATMPTFLGMSFGGPTVSLTRNGTYTRKTAAYTSQADLPAGNVAYASLATSGSIFYGAGLP